MTTSQLAWLAGYLEGEGCFRLGVGGVRPGSTRTLRPTGTPTIKVCSTDQDVVVKAADLMACRAKTSSRTTVVGKAVYTAELFGDKALQLMQMIIPYMGSRRRAKIRSIIADCALRPGHTRGEGYRNSKLTAAAVIDIRRLAEEGERQVVIARRYGVSQALVSLVIMRRAWTHIH